MSEPSRRAFLGSAAATAASLGVANASEGEKVPVGNPGGQRQGDAVLEIDPKSGSIPGPKNEAAAAQAPSSMTPPSTDRGYIGSFWYPYSRAHRRIQEGGWARQVTVKDVPIATTIAGVDMRLIAGGIRELHWHLAGEWAFMLYGNARITCLDPQSRSYVADVKQGNLWYFPEGYPHSIQGLEPDGCEFLLVFDNGGFSEDDTFLISDWMAHTPVDVLAKNFGLPKSAFDNIPEHQLYIFPGKVPGPLAADQKEVLGPAGPPPNPFSYSPAKQKPDVQDKGGEVRIVDSSRFKVSTTIAAAIVTVHPGGIRELHWHPNADEWQYYISGQARMTLFQAVGIARTMDFYAGSMGYAPRAFGHYVENTGNTDLVFLELFKSDRYESISLADWMAQTPIELVMAHTHMSRKALESIPKRQVTIVPD